MKSFWKGFCIGVTCTVFTSLLIYGLFFMDDKDASIPKDTSECIDALNRLKDSCQKGARQGAERPSVETDYIGHCLWAMDRVYGDKFPIGENIRTEETRPGFFFECIEEYPKWLENFCCYARDLFERDLARCQTNLYNSRRECNIFCDQLNEHYKTDLYCNCN